MTWIHLAMLVWLSAGCSAFLFGVQRAPDENLRRFTSGVVAIAWVSSALMGPFSWLLVMPWRR